MKKYIKPVFEVIPVDVDTDLMVNSPEVPVKNEEGNGIQFGKSRYFDDDDMGEDMYYEEEDLW